MTMKKIVVKVDMHNDKKKRKALRIVVSLCGVQSASFVGSDKDQIAVTGTGIDPLELTILLRKGVGYTELVSFVEERKPEAWWIQYFFQVEAPSKWRPSPQYVHGSAPAEAKESKVTVEVNPYQYYYNYYGTPYYVYGM